MKPLMLALALLLAGQLKAQDYTLEKQQYKRNLWIWTGIGAGVAGSTLALAHYNNGDKDFIYGSGAFLMGWVVAGVGFNAVPLIKINRKEKQATALQIAPAGTGLAFRFTF